MTAAADGTDRSALKGERDFLLRSIDDLEAERSAGELDEQQYQRLVDDYTARAAAVLRALEDDQPAPVPMPQPSRSRLRRAGVVGGLIVLAVVAGVLLASSLGLRQPGETITGNSQSAGATRVAFAQAVERRPDDVAARLAYARFLLQSGEVLDALKQYDEAARLDPSNGEALAYGGWIVYLAGLPEEAMVRLDNAVAADPEYADGHFFRGVVLLRGLDDREAAATELRTYLRLAPQGAMQVQVEELLQRIEGGAPQAG